MRSRWGETFLGTKLHFLGTLDWFCFFLGKYPNGLLNTLDILYSGDVLGSLRGGVSMENTNACAPYYLWKQNLREEGAIPAGVLLFFFFFLLTDNFM